MPTFRVALYAGTRPLPESEILAVFSWRVWRVPTLDEAIRRSLDESGPPTGRWRYVFVKWPASRDFPRVRVHAYQLVVPA